MATLTRAGFIPDRSISQGLLESIRSSKILFF